jgi:hypothetical protein
VHKQTQRRSFREILFIVCIVVGVRGLTAQQPSIALDLNDPVFRRHSSLPINEMSGAPILESLQPLVDEQVRRGKSGSTVYSQLRDEDTGLYPYQGFTSLLQDLTCRAEIVVVGKAQNSMSHLSASGAAIYTDYEFAVETVFKSNLPLRLNPTPRVVITRPGGILPVVGGFVRYDNGLLPTLKPNRQYLLFLRQLPQTAAYEPAQDARKRLVFSTFELRPNGTQWRAYRDAYMNRDFPELGDRSLRSAITSSVSNCK